MSACIASKHLPTPWLGVVCGVLFRFDPQLSPLLLLLLLILSPLLLLLTTVES
jgi:hypothetical protein